MNDVLNNIKMLNTLTPNEKLIVGGQPSADDLRVMKSLGIKYVVNLRPESELIDFDEAAIINELGMKYVIIPVTDINTFTLTCAEQLQAVLNFGKPTLVHCASGNRVGALFALKAFWCDKSSPEDAFEQGLQTGLTKLAPEIKTVLGLAS